MYVRYKLAEFETLQFTTTEINKHGVKLEKIKEKRKCPQKVYSLI